MLYSERFSARVQIEAQRRIESMIALSLLLPRLLNATESNPELAETVAKLAWTRAAGEGLRNYGVPSRLYRTTLLVSVADAIWHKQRRKISIVFLHRTNKRQGRS